MDAAAEEGFLEAQRGLVEGLGCRVADPISHLTMIEMRVRPAWVRWVIDLKKEYCHQTYRPRRATLHANAIIRWHAVRGKPSQPSLTGGLAQAAVYHAR